MISLFIFTLLNAALCLSVRAMLLYLYRQSKTLGWTKACFTIKTMPRRFRRPPYHILYVSCKEASMMQVVSRQDAQKLSENKSGYIMIYLRKFSSRWLSPNLEQYEFSLTETDWTAHDRKLCRNSCLYMFFATELIIVLLTLRI